MGKTRRGHKEFSKEQELKYENQKLRKQISALRKQLARLDLDRHSYVRDIVEEHLALEDQETTAKDMLDSMKNEWRCNSCGTGYLEIHLYTRQDGTFYYRLCNNCPHRTVGKRYDPNSVRGIMRQEKPPKNK